MTPLRHGGDLADAAARFGEPSQGWLDLSTGLNPQPYPFLPPPPEAWQCLPQANALAALIDAAAQAYGVAEPACVVPAPGTQALLQWLPRLRPRSRVAILSPTYGEHARCWASVGHDVIEVRELPGASETDVVVLVNPNNPDGRCHDPQQLRTYAERQAAGGGWLVVDEAFADTEPALSIAPVAGTPGLIVLRSFGKFYGLGGLRLGFALAPADVAAAMREALGPWSVGGPALAIGTQALSDRAWAAEMRDRLGLTSAKLSGLLLTHGLTEIGGTSLFRLVEHPRAAALFEHLARRGILVRTFAEHPTWLRFGLPPSAGFARLEAALAAWSA